LFHIEYRYILSSLAFLGFLGWWALDEILDRRKEENVRIFLGNLGVLPRNLRLQFDSFSSSSFRKDKVIS
jgi:hypothetical protein